MKRLFVLMLFISCSGAAFSQRIRSTLIPEVDDINTYADTMVAKSNVTTAVCYRCRKCKGKDPGVLVSETTYDKKGRITRVTTPQYTVNYKWLTDSTMESLADYAPGALVLGFFYVDTIIKGRVTRVCLYPTDKNNHVWVRSVYVMGTGMWKEIKRYGQDNKLVEICYPLGNIIAKQYWQDTAIDNYDSVVTSISLYDGYVHRNKYVYSKAGKLKEVWETSHTFNRSDSSVYRSVRFYDEDGRLIVQDEVDLDNQLNSEERFYYKEDKLIRYTQDDYFIDSVLRKQTVYNNAGQVVYTSEYNRYNGSSFIFKYHFDDRNLLIRQEYYENEKLKYFQRFEYK